MDRPSPIDDATEHIQSNTEKVLHWLYDLAEAIIGHRNTDSYQTQRRKRGENKGTGHGLTAAEFEERIKARDYQHAKHLARQWDIRGLTYDKCDAHQWSLLQKYWSGELQNSGPGTKPSMPRF